MSTRLSLSLWLFVLGLSAVACDDLTQAITSRVSADSPAPPAPPAAPRPPHRCETCSGTGSVTSSEETRLPAHISRCDLAATGFLGMGSDRVATVAATNDGNEAGDFTFRVSGKYPGGGVIQHGEVAHIHMAGHIEGVREIRFTPQDGMTSVECSVISPVVIQRHQSICPTCAGRGMVP